MTGDTHSALVVRWLALVRRQPSLKGLTQANLVERFADVAQKEAGAMLKQALKQNPHLTLYEAVKKADAFLMQQEQKKVVSLHHNLQGLRTCAQRHKAVHTRASKVVWGGGEPHSHIGQPYSDI